MNEQSKIFLPGMDLEMNISLNALHKIAQFILNHPMKPGENFTITGTDYRKLIIHLK